MLTRSTRQTDGNVQDLEQTRTPHKVYSPENASYAGTRTFDAMANWSATDESSRQPDESHLAALDHGSQSNEYGHSFVNDPYGGIVDPLVHQQPSTPHSPLFAIAPTSLPALAQASGYYISPSPHLAQRQGAYNSSASLLDGGELDLSSDDWVRDVLLWQASLDWSADHQDSTVVDSELGSQQSAFVDFSLINFPDDNNTSQKSEHPPNPPAKGIISHRSDLSVPISMQDAHLNAVRLNANIESPLELDEDSPVLDSGSAFFTSPYEASWATVPCDGSFESASLFPSSASAAPFDASLFTAFPGLDINASSTSRMSTLENASTQSHAAIAATTAEAPPRSHVTRAAPSPLLTSVKNEDDTADPDYRDEGQDQGDNDEEYLPSNSTRSGSPASLKRTRKRKSSASVSSSSAGTGGLGPRDAATGKRIFHGVRSSESSIPIVPLEAPIQPRQWRGESRTSRKVLPKAIAKSLPGAFKKRKLSMSTDSHGEGVEATAAVDEDVLKFVDERRAQNTLAARKSRVRKAAYLAGLEEENERLRVENEDLRDRLKEAGIEI